MRLHLRSLTVPPVLTSAGLGDDCVWPRPSRVDVVPGFARHRCEVHHRAMYSGHHGQAGRRRSTRQPAGITMTALRQFRPGVRSTNGTVRSITVESTNAKSREERLAQPHGYLLSPRSSVPCSTRRFLDPHEGSGDEPSNTSSGNRRPGLRRGVFVRLVRCR